ncbi:hypothetical protein H5410_019385 [Solanum commersonii]|uniref:Adenylate isopentenyltransferase n=1 Tax=Solanum commersonii TaxID=4109 RepID=A0A9J5Z853_SOLCO|nr:hypothetical protein H5410_019385 [Solanum commersonii]
MDTFINNNKSSKKKVVFVMGATGTGKSRLSIDLAIHFQGEIINSDKMQIYKGLDIITNKITDIEKQGVPHHLLGEIEPDADFTADDFCIQAIICIEKILKSENIPIIVGGSNSYVEKFVKDPVFMFKSNYDCCFIWIDVAALPILNSFVCQRVDQMVHADADYTRGIRRSIGVSEMDKYLREENKLDNNEVSKRKLLESAIEEIKLNTCILICHQLEKIRRLKNEKMWPLNYIDATNVFRKMGKEGADNAWKEIVSKPSSKIVEEFLKYDGDKINHVEAA